MSPDTRIEISRHGLYRYRQRCGPATEAVLDSLIRRSSPAGRRTRASLRHLWREQGRAGDVFRPGNLYFVHYGRKILFVLRVVGRGHFVLVTCWPFG